MAALVAALYGCDADVTVQAVATPDATAGDAAVVAADSGQATGNPRQVAAKPDEHPAVKPPATVKAPVDGLVMHEWGTFTSVQGSDGSTQDGMQHEEEALPDFVYARDRLAHNQKMAEGLPEQCNQKMETPVVYFYTAKAQKVKLNVEFKNGIISQWFPAVTAMQPPVGALASWNLKPGQGLSKGSLTWDVLVDPALDMAKAPLVPADSVWQPSRLTQATPLRFVGTDGEYNNVDQTERFLFYRGLGRFTLPVQLKVYPKGGIAVQNNSDDALPYAIMLRATKDTKGGLTKGGVSEVGVVSQHTQSFEQYPWADMPRADAVAKAKALLKKNLIATGLYDDEAQAMVDTWQKSWFMTPGTRLLYILPAKWTQNLLPMQVSPAPSQTVRTLVGRIEILSEQEEMQAQQAVIKAQTAGTQVLAEQLDRFLEPRIRRACQQLDAKTYGAHCAKMIEWAAAVN